MNIGKQFNPKSSLPCIFIPTWLSQVSCELISVQSKMVYGRLAQWSNNEGIIFRSVSQLSIELGLKRGVIERSLKELRDLKLIQTYRKKEGGVNHYIFLYHEWMFEEIKPELCYSSMNTPTIKSGATPTIKYDGTPPSNMMVHINKNINNKENKRSIDHFESYPQRNVSDGTESMLHTTPHAHTDLLELTNGTSDDAQEKSSIPKNGTANASSDARDYFDEFWDLYPVKKGKAKAHKAWIKQKLDKHFDAIVEKLKLQIENDVQWQNKQFIPHGDTYVRNAMWEDEIQLPEIKETPVAGKESVTIKPYAFDLDAQNDMHDRKYGLGKYAGQGRMIDKREVSQGPKPLSLKSLLKMIPTNAPRNDFKAH